MTTTTLPLWLRLQTLPTDTGLRVHNLAETAEQLPAPGRLLHVVVTAIVDHGDLNLLHAIAKHLDTAVSDQRSEARQRALQQTLAADCPTCHQPAGKACTRGAGSTELANRPHAARRDLAHA